MKCDRCNGQGFSVIEKWKCPVCHGTGFVEQTNDEWRRTCSAEEFAEWLKEVAQICFACSDMRAETSEEYCKYGYASEKDKWIEWLKEKHIE